ncbi:MAG: hypothetical protein QMD71_00665 [bacterium]|nr:hypothetical protein [bacterium]
MKWNSHLRIAKWVGSALNLSQPNLLKLADGSVAPDNRWDHRYHHNHRYLDSKIRNHIIKARGLFLKGDDKCFFETGVALHYIQDRCLPTESYIRHLNIEEELAKISETKPGSRRSLSTKGYLQLETVRKRIMESNIGEMEKELLLSLQSVKEKSFTISLALINLPANIESKLLLNIITRISLGVATSILSHDPPFQLLVEKFKVVTKTLTSATTKFKVHMGIEIILPLLFLYYGKIGILAYILITVVNLLSLLPCIAILKKAIPKRTIKAYIRLQENSKLLFTFFALVTLVTIVVSIIFLHKVLLAGLILALISLLHLIYPKISIDDEVTDEIDWYNW